MFWYIPALLSAIFVSLTRIFTKKTLVKEHSSEFLVIYHILLSVFLSLILLPFLSFNISLWIVLILYFISLIISFADYYIIKAYRHKDLSLISPLSNINPLFVLILSFIFLGETPALMQLGGIVLILIGAYVLEAEHHILKINSHLRIILKSKYSLFAILAAFLYALSSLGSKFVLSSTTPFVVLAFLTLFTTFNYIIASIFIFRHRFKNLKKGFNKFGKGIFLVAIFTLISDATILIAMSLTYVSLVIPIKRLSTLFDVLIGGRIFKEKNLKQKAIACIIMVLGVFLIVF